MDQKFFHSSDIPDHVKTIVNQVKHETDFDVLGRISPNWNQSVHLEKKVDLKDLYFKI